MRIFVLIIGLLFVSVVGLRAEDNLPGQYRTTELSLNVRTGPGVRYRDIGNIPPLSLVTVVGFSRNGNWAEITWEGRSAWISTRFITREASAVSPQADIATDIDLSSLDGLLMSADEVTCVGTEPFWNLNIMDQTLLSFDTPDGDPVESILENISRSENNPSIHMFSSFGFTGIIHREQCSDGMSDRTYDWALDLVVSDGLGQRLKTGCCFIGQN